MKKKSFFSKHKIPMIILIAVLVLAAAGTAAYFALRPDETQEEEEEPQNLADMMADLVNEPASGEDEPYKPSEKSEDEITPIRVMVNKTRNCITVYEQDDSGEFAQPVKAMNCSVGYNTPTGTFETGDRYIWKIVNGNVWAQYATRITGNVLFHSVQYYEKEKSSLIAKYYNQLGTNASAGCIRVMASDARWLMEHCVEGTEVEIYEDDDPGPLGKPVSIVVAADEQWDPSDPDPDNPWKGHEAVIAGAANRTVERNIGFDYLEGLTGTDTVGNNVTSLIEVETDLDIKKTGTYKVKYTLTDGVGSTAQAEVVYTVVDTMAPCFSGVRAEIRVGSEYGITAETLLEKIYVVDNNEILSKDRIDVTIPDLTNGYGGEVVYTVKDDYGNTAIARTTLIIDNDPPEIHRYADAGSFLSNEQVVDEAFALSRVYATDNGEELPKSNIRVTIYNADWGYTFVYVATDKSGLTATYTDTVTYMSYSLSSNGTITVTDLSTEQLRRGVILTNSAGEVITDTSGVITSTQPLGGNRYMVTYQYNYTSPLGTRSATTSRMVELAGATAEPGASASPSEEPNGTQTPEPTETEVPQYQYTEIPGESS